MMELIIEEVEVVRSKTKLGENKVHEVGYIDLHIDVDYAITKHSDMYGTGDSPTELEVDIHNIYLTDIDDPDNILTKKQTNHLYQPTIAWEFLSSSNIDYIIDEAIKES
jgi:hypothetical protein